MGGNDEAERGGVVWGSSCSLDGGSLYCACIPCGSTKQQNSRLSHSILPSYTFGFAISHPSLDPYLPELETRKAPSTLASCSPLLIWHHPFPHNLLIPPSPFIFSPISHLSIPPCPTIHQVHSTPPLPSKPIFSSCSRSPQLHAQPWRQPCIPSPSSTSHPTEEQTTNPSTSVPPPPCSPLSAPQAFIESQMPPATTRSPLHREVGKKNPLPNIEV